MTTAYPSTDMEMSITWGDCDAAGISYYARTFDWFTNGRMFFWEKSDVPYMQTFHQLGIAIVCLTADCQYKKMLRPEDKVIVRTSLTEFTRSRMAFHYQIIKDDGQIACEGVTTHTYVDNDGNPFNLKKRFPELWEKLTKIWPEFNH